MGRRRTWGLEAIWSRCRQGPWERREGSWFTGWGVSWGQRPHGMMKLSFSGISGLGRMDDAAFPWPLAPLLKPGPIGAGLLEEVQAQGDLARWCPCTLHGSPSPTDLGSLRVAGPSHLGGVTLRTLFCPGCFLLPSSRILKLLTGPPDSSSPIQDARKAFPPDSGGETEGPMQ